MNWRKIAARLFRVSGRNSIYFYSLIIGIISGLGAHLFLEGLHYVELFTFKTLVGLGNLQDGSVHNQVQTLPVDRRIIFFFLPIIGGLLVGIIIHYFSADAGGTGTDAMIVSFHQNEGRIDTKVPLYKTIATIITLGTGGSGGKEGPTSYIGAGIGSIVANLLNVGARARRTLLLAGTAGGLGAVFLAPFGGAITAAEVIYKEDIESDSLVPCIISSVSAYLVYKGTSGQSHIYPDAQIAFPHYREFIFYLALGLLCYAAGFVFVKIFHGLGHFFSRLKVHRILRPALGGVVIGCLALIFPQSIGTDGFGLLPELIKGRNPLAFSETPLWGAFAFLLIAVVKMLSTSFTVASGGSGGIFGPSLFIGGMLGGFVGSLAMYFFPGYNISLPSFVLVGMGAFFAGIARAPIAAMIMVCDMIGNYMLLPPLMLVSVLAFILHHRWSIYKGQVATRFQSPAHYWDMNLNILENMTIEKDFPEYGKLAMAPKSMLLSQLEDKALEIQASDFVVLNPDDSYHGIISLRRVRLTRDLDHIRFLITLEDADVKIPTVAPESSLGDALKIILENEVDKVAILDNNKVVGYIRHTDVLKLYHTTIQRT